MSLPSISFHTSNTADASELPAAGDSAHVEPPVLEVSQQLGAYLVHLMWSDLAQWDNKRRLSRADAEALAAQLAEQLPPTVRGRLAALQRRSTAA